jgi:hypothetical protein
MDNNDELVFPLVDQRVALGMKDVGPDNWLSPDRAALWASNVAPGTCSEVAALIEVGNYFAHRFRAITVSPAVSEEAARLFAVAKGCVTYAVFYYPLLEVGLDRGWSAVEVAVREAIEAHGKRARSNDPHAKRIDWLCRFGWIDGDFCWRLHGTRDRRNGAKHERQNIIMPIDAVRNLRWIAEDLEQLAVGRDLAVPPFASNAPEHEHRRYPWA